MDAVLVSDLHLDGPGDPTQAAFLRFLGTLPPSVTLVVLGDAFHAWWTFDGEPFTAYAAVATALLDFNLVYLPGNHDFHAPAYFGARGATVAGQNGPGATVRRALGALDAHLSHGDEVDTSVGYRGLHAVLRGRAFHAAMVAAGPGRAWHLLHHLAGERALVSRHTVDDDGDDGSPLVLAQRALAAERAAVLGVHLVAMGHTHVPELSRRGEAQFLNTGDWVAHRSYGIVTGEEVRLLRYDG